MAKYGQPFWWLRGELKRWLKAHQSEDRRTATLNWIKEFSRSITRELPPDSKDNGTNSVECVLYAEFCSHETVRLYIQDLELVKFLKSTSCPQIGATKAAMNSFIEKYGHAIHLLTPDKKVMSFVLDNDINNKNTSIFGAYAEHDQGLFSFNDETGTFADVIENQVLENGISLTEPRAREFLDSCEIMVNLLYYIATFPDALVDGAPTDKGGIQILPKSNHSVVIKTHPDIVEPRVPGSRATHFRHGHYRFLKSERFTHMQGKFVFVRGSIVHGSTAKTVVG